MVFKLKALVTGNKFDLGQLVETFNSNLMLFMSEEFEFRSGKCTTVN